MLSSLLDVVTRHYYLDLSDEREEIFHEILRRQIRVYTKYRRVSTPNGVSALIEHIPDAYNLAFNLWLVGQPGRLNTLLTHVKNSIVTVILRKRHSRTRKPEKSSYWKKVKLIKLSLIT